ncbi:MAG: N-acetylmuramoyl-L-alanine amidase [Caldilineaceae bacterium]
MRRPTLQRIQRYLLLVSFATLLGIALIAWQIASQDFVAELFAKHIALISGHAGNDSGATCVDADGKTTVTEAHVVANVTQLAAQRLRRAGANVTILNEFDDRLSGLHADVLLSMHADSCIDNSGYKAAASFSRPLAAADQRLVACIEQFYPAATGLAPNPNTITHDMTNYHAFREIDPSTPAAIIETGFLGGDQDLLVKRPEVVAKGITDSLICFFTKEPSAKANKP